MLDRLARLVDRSLVVVEDQPDGTARYRLLETLRQYACEKLLASGEEPVGRLHHRDWYLAFLRALGPFGSDLRFNLAPLIPEQENLRAALEWCLDADPAAGLELALGAADFWQWRHRQGEALRWLEAFLARTRVADATGSEAARETAQPTPAASRARALYWLGRLARELNDTERARAPAAESLALFRQTGDDAGAAVALHGLGLLARADARPEAARRLFEESLATARRAGRVDRMVSALRDLGLYWFSLGDLEQAKAASEECVALARSIDPRATGAPADAQLGIIALLEGDLPRARQILEEAVDHMQRMGYRTAYLGIAALGDLAVAEDNVEEARARYRQIVAESREHGIDVGWQFGLVGLGLLASRGGDYRRAAHLLGALTRSSQSALRVHAPHYVAPIEAALAACRSALGDAAFESIVGEARVMPFTELADYALEGPGAT